MDDDVEEKEEVVEGGGREGVDATELVRGGPRLRGEMVAEGRGESAAGICEGYFPGGGTTGGRTGNGEARGWG